jgi:hypothetical protein
MSDQPQPKRSLSEIGHLFLSDIRQKQTGPRPMRIPPARTDLTIDLTPEEFAQVFGEKTADESGPSIAPVQAVLASHLGTQQLARVQQYAASVCPQGKRIGLISVDASEFRLSLFEHNPNPHATADVQEPESLDARKMSESLDELAWDVDRWLLLLPSPRAPEARSLLRDLKKWTILSTCDHDGVVACYRTLKGLADLHRPMLSLATIEPGSEVDSQNAYQRLSSVCRQFLDWDLQTELPVALPRGVAEHVVLWCSGTRDKAQLAAAPQWQVVGDFLAKAKRSARAGTPMRVEASSLQIPVQPAPATPALEPDAASSASLSSDAMPPDNNVQIPTPPSVAQAASVEPKPAIPMIPAPTRTSMPEVIDLAGDHASAGSIVSAVVRGGHELVECPIHPPMCPEAGVAVSRDHRLTLVAVAHQGLTELGQIGKAYQWLIENRSLVAMAVPQMAIDAHQLPQLQLLVDQADLSAEVLQPIMQSTSVVVHAYRKLRWGGKTGLLLQAA